MSQKLHGRPRKLVAGVILVGVFCAAGAVVASALLRSGGDTDPSRDTSLAYELPPVNGEFDYQLGGAYDVLQTGNAPQVVARDATAAPLPGAYNICYINGFQTQPGEGEQWLANEAALLRDDAGELVVDPDWPDEYVLDPTSQANRKRILDFIAPIILGCAEAGFDAVEIDNLDSFTRFEQIERQGALALAQQYVELAHGAGLAIGQKNSAEITGIAHDELGFDFVVTESCAAWNECASYADVYGAQVLQIEYPEALGAADLSFAEVCAREDRAPLTILRDRNLAPFGTDGYRYEQCAVTGRNAG